MRKTGRVFAAAALVLAVPATSQAATWVGGRTTPSLREIVAVDATGEQGWIYGAEDVAGDGLQNFKQPEQSIDLRTAYAATDPTKLWMRFYVSDPSAVGGAVEIYAFIDADANPSTGRTAAATEINALFTTDPTAGGYDYVVGVHGNGSIDQVWEYRTATGQFAALPPGSTDATAEAGSDVDPIRIGGDAHGYAQAMVGLATVKLTPACGGRFYVRSVNTAPGLGSGDLDVGVEGACVPADANGDRVPDILQATTGCTSDAQCPANGVCVSGRCVLTAPCVVDTDCPAGQRCTPDGRCVLVGGGTCSTNAQCSGLVCTAGTCGPCTPGGTQCGAGQRCGPDGTCVNGSSGGGDGGISLAPGEQVEGGAFHCVLSRPVRAGAGVGLLVVGAVPLAFAARRRRRSKDKR